MPEIDTKARPWQEMMGMFSKYAADTKAEKTLFGQQLFISSQELKGVKSTKSEGVCHGLAVLYIEYKYRDNRAQFLTEMFHLCAGLAETTRPPLEYQDGDRKVLLPGISINDGVEEEKRRGIRKLESNFSRAEREWKRNPKGEGLGDAKRIAFDALQDRKRGFDSPELYVTRLRDQAMRTRFPREESLRNEIDTAHRSQHMDGVIQPQFSPGRTKERLLALGLRYDQSKTFDSLFYRNTKLAAFLAEHDPSYCLIKAPEHAMAAVRKDGTMSFFDPNFGEVKFREEERFKDFVVKFFSNERVRRNYKAANVNSIVFCVDRYSWSPARV